jgi:hypothetical protein
VQTTFDSLQIVQGRCRSNKLPSLCRGRGHTRPVRCHDKFHRADWPQMFFAQRFCTGSTTGTINGPHRCLHLLPLLMHTKIALHSQLQLCPRRVWPTCCDCRCDIAVEGDVCLPPLQVLPAIAADERRHLRHSVRRAPRAAGGTRHHSEGTLHTARQAIRDRRRLRQHSTAATGSAADTASSSTAKENNLLPGSSRIWKDQHAKKLSLCLWRFESSSHVPFPHDCDPTVPG